MGVQTFPTKSNGRPWGSWVSRLNILWQVWTAPKRENRPRFPSIRDKSNYNIISLCISSDYINQPYKVIATKDYNQSKSSIGLMMVLVPGSRITVTTLNDFVDKISSCDFNPFSNCKQNQKFQLTFSLHQTTLTLIFSSYFFFNLYFQSR